MNDTTMNHTKRIAKGDRIFIPILAMNRSKTLWGPDAHEFKCVADVLFSAERVRNGYAADQNGGPMSLRLSLRFRVFGVTC
jgi:hypothetical protein